MNKRKRGHNRTLGFWLALESIVVTLAAVAPFALLHLVNRFYWLRASTVLALGMLVIMGSVVGITATLFSRRFNQMVSGLTRGLRAVADGDFSQRLEPEEGRYDFDWLEAIIDRLYENGVYTVLATPSGAKPIWMSEKYPEIRRVRQMLTFIQGHYTQPLRVEDIAASVFISRRECMRAFQNVLGISPIQYVLQLRVRKAKELLLETGLSLGEICAACGFQGQSYFTKVFRERTGTTPGKFREGK